MGWLDEPNWRKINKAPVPILGGVAIYLSIVISLITVIFSHAFYNLPRDKIIGFFAASFIIFLSGLEDDIKGLKPLKKLFYQILAALIAYLLGFSILKVSNPIGGVFQASELLSMLLTIFWIVGFTNAINILDGLDGLAAGVISIIAGTLFFMGIKDGNLIVTIFSLGIIGSTLGFLPYNFYPAKIFMGDTGSMVLGFTVSLIAIEGSQKGTTFITILAPVIAMGIPVLDTGLAILRRSLSGRKIFEADRSHIHHKLLIQEGSQRKAVLKLYFLTVCFGMIAMGLSGMKGIWAFGGAILTAIAVVRLVIKFEFVNFNDTDLTEALKKK